MNKRYIVSRRFLIFWTLFVGIGAVAGAISMLADPSGKILGMDPLLPFFQVLPFASTLFSDFTFSGIMLLIVNGVTNLAAASLLLAKKPLGITLGMIFGITLMLWIVIQFVIFPPNIMSIIYFIFGFLQFVTGYVCLVGYKQSLFVFHPDDYPNINPNSDKLVVYFSRCGYTKKLAYKLADEQGARVLELHTSEKTSGDLGFWWCGKFGMQRKSMPISPYDVDPSEFAEVTLVSPVWVFGICAPIRRFCKQNTGKIPIVNYAITHFMHAKFTKIATQLDKLLATQHKTFLTYQCRFGKLKKLSTQSKTL